jgi:sugar lactone lactonase YvrE
MTNCTRNSLVEAEYSMSKQPPSHSAERSRALLLVCALSMLGACDAAQFTQDSDTVATKRSTPANGPEAASGGSAGDGAGGVGSAVIAAVGGAGDGSTQAAAGDGAAGSSNDPGMPISGTTSPAANGGGQAGAPAMALGKPTIFWLEITGNRVWRANSDGTNKEMLATGQGISTPDGIAVDPVGSYVYWTNMGAPLGGANLGSLQRLRLGALVVETVIPVGITNTPTQISLDAQHSMLYWCDREGAKVWRSKLNGSSPEVLVSGHNLFQLAGIALDVDKRQFYFTDRLGRHIYRASFDFPAGEDDGNRSDLEELFAFSNMAMPLDLDLDLEQRKIYWTDRARGTVQRANMDLPSGQSTVDRSDVELLVSNLVDPISLALDHDDRQLYFTLLNGDVWRTNLDGSDRKLVVSTGSAAGVKIVRMP